MAESTSAPGHPTDLGRDLLDDALEQAKASTIATPPDLGLPSEPSKSFIWVVLGVAVLVGLAVFWIADQAGVLDSPDDAPGATTISAVLVLLGTLLSELVVVVGLLIKHSIDLRNHRVAVYEQMRLATEAEKAAAQKWVEIAGHYTAMRSASLQQQVDNDRLRIDTIVGALGLLSDGASGAAPPPQQAGVLSALIQFGEHDLAASLLRQRWQATSQPLDTSSAMSLVDQFLADDRTTPPQLENVIRTVQLNASRLLVGETVYWPTAAAKGWPTTWPRRARYDLLVTVLLLFCGRAKSEDSSLTEFESYFLDLLLDAHEQEKDEALQGLALLLADLLKPLAVYPVGGHRRTEEQVLAYIAEHGPSTCPAPWRPEADVMRAWSEQATPVTSAGPSPASTS